MSVQRKNHMDVTGAAPPKHNPAIPEEAEKLDSELSALNQEIDLLIHRLEGLLCPPEPEAQQGRPSEAGVEARSPYAGQMAERRILVCRMRRAVNDAFARLEV